MPGPLDGLRRAGPSNMVEQELADMFKQKLHQRAYGPNSDEPYQDGMTEDGMLPIPHPPPGFRQGTLLPPKTGSYGGQEEPWDYLMRIVPELEGISPSVQVGPTKGVIDWMDASGFQDPSDYGKLNLLGALSPSTNKISINPSIAGKPQGGYRRDSTEVLRSDQDRVAAHEMYHAAGHVTEDREMGNLEGLMIMAREAQRQQKPMSGPVKGLQTLRK